MVNRGPKQTLFKEELTEAKTTGGAPELGARATWWGLAPENGRSSEPESVHI